MLFPDPNTEKPQDHNLTIENNENLITVNIRSKIIQILFLGISPPPSTPTTTPSSFRASPVLVWKIDAHLKAINYTQTATESSSDRRVTLPQSNRVSWQADKSFLF